VKVLPIVYCLTALPAPTTPMRSPEFAVFGAVRSDDFGGDETCVKIEIGGAFEGVLLLSFDTRLAPSPLGSLFCVVHH
jgi:hypothetical protein